MLMHPAELLDRLLKTVGRLAAIKLHGCLQVALFQGLDADARADLAKGVRDGGQHLNKLLKVLTVRSELNQERSGITLLGGPHNPELDGNVTAS